MKKLLCLLILCLVVSVGSGNVIKPVSVSGNIDGDAGSSVDYLLDDNAGYTAIPNLSDADGNEVTLDSGDQITKAFVTFGARGGGAHAESWTRPIGEGNPEFVFDLGSEIAIGSVLLWQYGNNGGAGSGNWGNSTKDFELIFHTEAEGPTFDFSTEAVEFAGEMDGIPGDDSIDNYAQFFGFGEQITAKYVGLRVASNYEGYEYEGSVLAGGDRFGLGEVRFADEVAPPQANTPDPADGEVDVQLDRDLSWQWGEAAENLDSFDIYFGTDEALVAAGDSTVFLGTQTATTFDPGALSTDSTYFWRIDEVDTAVPAGDPNIVVGDIWSFSTIGSIPTIITQPQSSLVNIGDSAEFFIEVASITSESYQWVMYTDPNFAMPGARVELTDGAKYTGTTTDTLFVLNVDNDDEAFYVCEVENAATTEPVVSDAVIMVVIDPAGQIAHWPLDGDLVDVIGGHDGVAVGAPTFAGSGIMGADSVLLDGVADYISVPYAVELNPESFTISLWALPAGGSGHRAALSMRDDNAGTFGYIIYAHPDNVWGMWTGAGGGWDVSTGKAVVEGQWVHIAATYEPTGISGTVMSGIKRLYINGVPTDDTLEVHNVVEAEAGFRVNTVNDLFFGAGQNEEPASFYFPGQIDDVKLFSGVLSETEILDEYLEVSELCMGSYPAMDFNMDCVTDMADFAAFAADWLADNRL